MINSAFATIGRVLIDFDNSVGANIGTLLTSYLFPTKNASFLEGNVITFFKISIYSLFLILPITYLKITRKENRLIFYLFLLILSAFAVSTFAIFLSFIQLLFT